MELRGSSGAAQGPGIIPGLPIAQTHEPQVQEKAMVGTVPAGQLQQQLGCQYKQSLLRGLFTNVERLCYEDSLKLSSEPTRTIDEREEP